MFRNPVSVGSAVGSLQPNAGRLSIAAFSVTWKKQKPLFQESFARFLKQSQPLHFVSGTETFKLLIRNTPKYTSVCHEEHPRAHQPSLPDLWGWKALREALSGALISCCTLQQKANGMVPAINTLSLELCKASPAQHISPWEVNPRRAELFTNLCTLCFWEDLSISEFFAQAAEVPSTYFQPTKVTYGHVSWLFGKESDVQSFFPQS